MIPCAVAETSALLLILCNDVEATISEPFTASFGEDNYGKL